MSHVERLVEQRNHLGRIATFALVLLNERAVHHHLGFQIRFRTHQYFIEHLLGKLLLMGGIIIVVKRHLGIGIVRLFLQHIGKALVGFLLAVVLYEPVAQHRLVLHIQRMLVYQRLQFLIGSLLVVHQFINSHFREGKLFAFTFFHFKTRNGFEYRFIILVLGIKLNQDAEGIGIIVFFGIQILIGIDGKIVFLATYIISAQLLCIGLVFRIQFYCLLHIGKCQGILFELRIEKRLIEIGFSRLRVNFPGMLKEVESRRIIAGSLLARSLQEEIVVALAVVRREMVLLNHRLLNRLHLLFTGKRRHGYRTQQDQPHCPTDISKIHLHDSNPFYSIFL